MNLLEYHTGHNVPVKIYMKIIIRWCTVPVEICAAVLFMWRCRFVFGDCLPLSLALHHLPTTINRATTTPIFAQQRIRSTYNSLLMLPLRPLPLLLPLPRCAAAAAAAVIAAAALRCHCRRRFHCCCRHHCRHHCRCHFRHPPPLPLPLPPPPLLFAV